MACRLVGDIVNLTLRNKLQWNFDRNSYISIEENVFENVVWKMATILSRPECINHLSLINTHRHLWPETWLLCGGDEENNRKWEQICFWRSFCLLFALYIRTYSPVSTHHISSVLGWRHYIDKRSPNSITTLTGGRDKMVFAADIFRWNFLKKSGLFIFLCS